VVILQIHIFHVRAFRRERYPIVASESDRLRAKPCRSGTAPGYLRTAQRSGQYYRNPPNREAQGYREARRLSDIDQRARIRDHPDLEEALLVGSDKACRKDDGRGKQLTR